MATLYLLRHAKTQIDSDTGRDFDRVLKPVGREDARAAGRWLAERESGHARVVSSTAKRAAETAQIVSEVLEIDSSAIVWEPDIYAATAGRLLAIADAHDDAETLLMIGHNPGFEMAAAVLLGNRESELAFGLPTGGIAAIERVSASGWSPGSGRLVGFYEGHRRHR